MVNRALVGMRRQKRSLLLSLSVVAAMVGYLSFAAPSALTTNAQSGAKPDCADAVMGAIIGRGSAAVERQAFGCMDPDFQQRVFQQGFATQYRTLAATAVSNLSRVGTHSTEAGDQVVYFADDAGDRSVPFVGAAQSRRQGHDDQLSLRARAVHSARDDTSA